MITQKDLQEAIAECQGVRNPTANTCIKLAAYYTIMDHISEKPGNGIEMEPLSSSYSYAAGPEPNVINYDGESDFAKTISGKEADDVLRVMDELMETLQLLNPRLYAGVMAKLSG